MSPGLGRLLNSSSYASDDSQNVFKFSEFTREKMDMEERENAENTSYVSVTKEMQLPPPRKKITNKNDMNSWKREEKKEYWNNERKVDNLLYF